MIKSNYNGILVKFKGIKKIPSTIALFTVNITLTRPELSSVIISMIANVKISYGQSKQQPTKSDRSY